MAKRGRPKNDDTPKEIEGEESRQAEAVTEKVTLVDGLHQLCNKPDVGMCSELIQESLKDAVAYVTTMILILQQKNKSYQRFVTGKNDLMRLAKHLN